jgi:hypothetical protein
MVRMQKWFLQKMQSPAGVHRLGQAGLGVRSTVKLLGLLFMVDTYNQLYDILP